MDNAEWDVIPLFGGALSMLAPLDWVDVSRLREVPDNQEVRVAPDASDASVIVELLARTEDVEDARIAEYLFLDVAQACDAERPEVLSAAPLLPTQAPVLNTLAGTVGWSLTGEMSVAKPRPGGVAGGGGGGAAPPAPHRVRVGLGVIRLPAPVDTDLLVTVNAPVGDGQGCGGGGARPELAALVLEKALASLVVHDFGLFGVDMSGGEEGEG